MPGSHILEHQVDYSDTTGQIQVLAANLNTGDVGVVTNNSFSLGCPSFSVVDRKVYYHYINESTGKYQVWSVNLKSDGVTGSGDDSMKVDGGVFPLAFAIGVRPTDVPHAENISTAFRLDQNFPNPFNPSTTIRYGLPHKSAVQLTVFNTLGQQVAQLVNGDMEAGYHEVRFDGSKLASGVYLYRVQAGNFVETRKLLLVR